MTYKKIKEIKEPILKEFTKKLLKEKIPCESAGLITLKNKKFLEVIVERKIRYSHPEILKKIPKTYRGLKVKII